jgi:hypothetical protein
MYRLYNVHDRQHLLAGGGGRGSPNQRQKKCLVSSLYLFHAQAISLEGVERFCLHLKLGNFSVFVALGHPRAFIITSMTLMYLLRDSNKKTPS